MKTHHSRRAYGFTLVELLVVIAIIAVLAGAGFAAGNAAVQKAKKTTALATAISIEKAVNDFYTEYGSLPIDPVPAAAVTTNTGNGLTMVKVLLAQADPATTALNPRSIKFLSVREGKNNRNGLIYGAGSPPAATGLFDPWGNPFNVVLDNDYDDVVTATVSGTPVTLNGRRVVAWSEGADARTARRPADDVGSWK